jgi:nicotinamidase-related amidase
MRILRENCTGLVIDIQEKLFPIIAEKEQLAANCIKLIEGFKILEIPTIVTQQYTKGLGATISEISSLFQPFSFIEKTTFSCVEEIDYLNYLKKSEKTTVLLCGIESHVCVLQTAIDLLELGYNPIVVSDCISSRDLYEKQIALNRFQLEGIRISTMESILFELTRTAKSSEFKSISKLVK